MDTGDGMQCDFVLSDALAVCYHLPYYLQRNEKQKVDVGGYTDSYLCSALFAQITNFVLR